MTLHMTILHILIHISDTLVPLIIPRMAKNIKQIPHENKTNYVKAT